jgi:hypothetical protein
MSQLAFVITKRQSKGPPFFLGVLLPVDDLRVPVNRKASVSEHALK